MSAHDIGKALGWGSVNDAARAAREHLDPNKLRELGLTKEVANEWRDYYRKFASDYPGHESAAGRADFMEAVMEVL